MKIDNKSFSVYMTIIATVRDKTVITNETKMHIINALSSPGVSPSPPLDSVTGMSLVRWQPASFTLRTTNNFICLCRECAKLCIKAMSCSKYFIANDIWYSNVSHLKCFLETPSPPIHHHLQARFFTTTIKLCCTKCHACTLSIESWLEFGSESG